MKRFLVIAPHFYPYNNPRAMRWTAIVQAWAAMGHEVVVITSKGPAGKIAELPDIQVVRTGFNTLREGMQHLRGTGAGRGLVGAGKPTRSERWLQWLSDNGPAKIWWPDHSFLWVKPANRAIKQASKEKSFDAIYSVGLPFSAHWATYLALSPDDKTPWVVDYGDPFSLMLFWEINNPAFYKKRNHDREGLVLTRATAVAFTNANVAREYAVAFPTQAEKCQVIGPIAQVWPPKSSILPATKKIRIGYFGHFYQGLRSPAPLLTLVKNLSAELDIEVHLVGEWFADYWPIFEDGCNALGDDWIHHGHLAAADATALMHEMDFLLNVGNESSNQLPSKCADYYQVGKPVIHIRIVSNDPCDTYFVNHPLYLSIRPDDTAATTKFVWATQGKSLDQATIDTFLTGNNVQAVARAYEGLGS
jgi:hypothetical protein